MESLVGYFYPIFASREDAASSNSHPVAIYHAHKAIAEEERHEEAQKFYIESISENVPAGQSFAEYCPCGSFVDPDSFVVTIRPAEQLGVKQHHINFIGEEDRDKHVYEMVDGTTGMLYYRGGEDGDPNNPAEWGLAANVAWNCISETTLEYRVSYRQYFMEALERAGIHFAGMNPAQMYAITFCNPRVHLMSSEYAVYCWGSLLSSNRQNDEPNSCENMETNWSTPKRIMGKARIDGYVVVEEKDGKTSVTVHRSIAIADIAGTLYSDRSRFMKGSKTYEQALYRQVFNIIFDSRVNNVQIYRYANSHFRQYMDKAKGLIEKFVAEYDGSKVWKNAKVHAITQRAYEAYKPSELGGRSQFDMAIRNPLNVDLFLIAYCGYEVRQIKPRNSLLDGLEDI